MCCYTYIILLRSLNSVILQVDTINIFLLKVRNLLSNLPKLILAASESAEWEATLSVSGMYVYIYICIYYTQLPLFTSKMKIKPAFPNSASSQQRQNGEGCFSSTHRANWILETVAYARLDRCKKHIYNRIIQTQSMINKVLKLCPLQLHMELACAWQSQVLSSHSFRQELLICAGLNALAQLHMYA